MADRSHCYNIPANSEVKELLQRFEEEFNEKYPEGNATQKKNYLLKQFKDQQTQAKQNIESNSAALKAGNEFILNAQESQRKQGFKANSYSQILKQHFLQTGKHYEGADLNFYNTTMSLVNRFQKDFEADLISVLKNDYYNIIAMDYRREAGIKLNEDIRRELARMNPRENQTVEATGNETALRIAKVIDKHNEQSLKAMASADIPYAKRILENNRKGYDGLQTHDKNKLRNTDSYENDYRTWRDFIKDKLIPAQQKIILDDRKGKLIFDKLIGDKQDTRLFNDFSKYVNDDVDLSIDIQRGLYFMNIEDSLAYDRRFGVDGGIINKSFNQLGNFARQINSKKEFGANPYAVLTKLSQLGEKEEGVPKGKRILATDEITQYYDMVMGKSKPLQGLQATFAKIGANIRTLKNLTLYGSTAINVRGLDIQTAKLKANERNGDFNFVKTILGSPLTVIEGAARNLGSVASIFNPKTKRGLNITQKEQALRMGVSISTIASEQRRYWQDDKSSKSIEWLSRKFSSASLLEYTQNSTEIINANQISFELASDLTKSWNEVSASRTTFLGKSGIKENEFNALKTVAPAFDSESGADLFYPSFVRSIKDEDIRPIINDRITSIQKRKQIELGALQKIKDEDIELQNLRSEERLNTREQKTISEIQEQRDKRTKVTYRLDEENNRLVDTASKIQESEKFLNDTAKVREEVGTSLEKRIKKLNDDYEGRRKEIISRYNVEEKNAYALARIDLENKLRTSITSELIKIQSLSTLNNSPKSETGTPFGELARTIAMLKTAPSNYYRNVVESLMFNPNLSKYGRLSGLVGFSLSSIFVALGSIWQRDILSGKEPRKLDLKMLGEAVLFSGVSTLWGEMANSIFGSSIGTSRNPEGTIATDTLNFLSPLFGGAVQVSGAVVRGDTDRIIKSIGANLPFQNIWFARAGIQLSLDALSQSLGGEGLNKRQKNISKQENIMGERRTYLAPLKYAYE